MYSYQIIIVYLLYKIINNLSTYKLFYSAEYSLSNNHFITRNEKREDTPKTRKAFSGNPVNEKTPQKRVKRFRGTPSTRNWKRETVVAFCTSVQKTSEVHRSSFIVHRFNLVPIFLHRLLCLIVSVDVIRFSLQFIGHILLFHVAVGVGVGVFIPASAK